MKLHGTENKYTYPITNPKALAALPSFWKSHTKTKIESIARNRIVWFLLVKFLIDLFCLDKKIPKQDAPVKIKIKIIIQKNIDYFFG